MQLDGSKYPLLYKNISLGAQDCLLWERVAKAVPKTKKKNGQLRISSVPAVPAAIGPTAVNSVPEVSDEIAAARRRVPHRHGEHNFNIFRVIDGVTDGVAVDPSDPDVRREYKYKGQRSLETVRKIEKNPNLQQRCVNDDLVPKKPIRRPCRKMWSWQQQAAYKYNKEEPKDINPYSRAQKRILSTRNAERQRVSKFKWHLEHVAKYAPSNRMEVRRHPPRLPDDTTTRCIKDHHAALLDQSPPRLADRAKEMNTADRPILKPSRPQTARVRTTPSTTFAAPPPAATETAEAAPALGKGFVPVPPPPAPAGPKERRERPLSARVKSKISDMADKYCL